MRTPITATQYDNYYVYIDAYARSKNNRAKSWHVDDDDNLRWSRLFHTEGLVEYIADHESRERAIRALHEDAKPAATSTPASTAASASTNETTFQADDECDDEIPSSQVDVYPPLDDTTPVKKKKRSHSGSPKDDNVNLKSSLTTTTLEDTNNQAMRHTQSDTQFLIVTVASFVVPSEILSLLTTFFVNTAVNPLRKVLHAKKRGCNKCYLVVEVVDAAVGNIIIASLSDKDYCNIPLNPGWVSALTWANFFTICQKDCLNPEALEKFSLSTTIQRIKQECPL